MSVCTKKRYISKAVAKAMIKELNHVHRNDPDWHGLKDAYKCPDCGYWHTTSYSKQRTRDLTRKLNNQ